VAVVLRRGGWESAAGRITRRPSSLGSLLLEPACALGCMHGARSAGRQTGGVRRKGARRPPPSRLPLCQLLLRRLQQWQPQCCKSALACRQIGELIRCPWPPGLACAAGHCKLLQFQKRNDCQQKKSVFLGAAFRMPDDLCLPMRTNGHAPHSGCIVAHQCKGGSI
jgi:hypothetical protein